MKKLILSALTAACIISAMPGAFAQSASFTYTNVPVGPVAAGSSFTIGINVVFSTGGTATNLFGLSYWMFQQSPASGFPFSITNRDLTGSQFNQAQSLLTYPQILDPINRNSNLTTTNTDLGAGTSSTPPGSGTYFVANLTFSLATNAPAGVYTIRNTTSTTPNVGNRTSFVSDSGGHLAPIAASSFNITVVPEPSTFALLGLGTITAGAAFYRRRRLAKS